ncbi:hypothetical protein D3C78_1481820 [compost metagenome]
MLTGFHRHRSAAEVEGTEDEGIENLAGRPVVITLRLPRELAVGIRGDTAQGRIALQIVVVVRVVVPTRCAYAHAVVVLVDHIHLGQYVETTLPHVAALGGVVRLMVGGIVAEIGVDGLHAPTQPKTELGGPVDLQVGIARVDGNGMRQRADHCTDQQHRRD